MLFGKRNANFVDAVVELEFVMGWLFSFVSSGVSIILISVIGCEQGIVLLNVFECCFLLHAHSKLQRSLCYCVFSWTGVIDSFQSLRLVLFCEFSRSRKSFSEH